MRSTMLGLVFAAVVVSGIYVLPNVAAKFSGSHTMEVNTTNGLGDYSDFYAPSCSYCHEGTGVLENFPRCTTCHGYILDELNATPISGGVLSAHTPGEYGGSPIKSDVNYACVMCHHPPKIDFTGSHTKVGVVACTYCHGNSTDPGVFYNDWNGPDHPATDGPNESSWVGPRLANSNDSHSNWFSSLDQSESMYPFPGTNANFTTGFFACLACHTHLEMNMRLERPQAFNINMTLNESTDTFYIEGPVINYSSPNLTYAQRPRGSVWS